SPVLPDWPDVEIRADDSGDDAPAELLLYHFREHLGRAGFFNFPGWYRSFAFAGRYAYANGFDKVIHVESDAFLIGARVQRYFNDATSGWIALWCRLHNFPECGIQLIAGQAVERFAQLEQTHPHQKLVGREIELQLPFDRVENRFIGDRYGEYLPFVPGNAEYAICGQPYLAKQARHDDSNDYYWWLTQETGDKVGEITTSSAATAATDHACKRKPGAR